MFHHRRVDGCHSVFHKTVIFKPHLDFQHKTNIPLDANSCQMQARQQITTLRQHSHTEIHTSTSTMFPHVQAVWIQHGTQQKSGLFFIGKSSSKARNLGFPSGFHVLQGQLVIDAAVVAALQLIIALSFRISLPGRWSWHCMVYHGMLGKANHENFWVPLFKDLGGKGT